MRFFSKGDLTKIWKISSREDLLRKGISMEDIDRSYIAIHRGGRIEYQLMKFSSSEPDYFDGMGMESWTLKST
ncbi:MAG: hypothetical protein M2R45_02862 [Verrucomicrobia subdivision 3 bacterium]|nr:hypothetical protein [Limisphaerales bacterium]MCS1414714.1 hypothetical protein [Limisphaerales bacterium]